MSFLNQGNGAGGIFVLGYKRSASDRFGGEDGATGTMESKDAKELCGLTGGTLGGGAGASGGMKPSNRLGRD